MKKTAKDTPQEVNNTLPLFYKEPAVLRAEEHAKCGLAEPNGFAFAREAIAIPLGIGEFVVALKSFPIVFSNTEAPAPIAVLGIKEGHNLFIEDDNSWKPETYIPAYIRRYPFIVTEVPEQNTQILAVDTASERFIPEVSADQEKLRLFNDESGPTELAQAAMNFCHAFHQEHLRTVEFCKAIKEAGILTPNHANMEFPDGTKYTLDGFQVIDEEAFRKLPDATISDWHKKGWLDVITMHFVARQNWQVLLDLNAIRNQAVPSSVTKH